MNTIANPPRWFLAGLGAGCFVTFTFVGSASMIAEGPWWAIAFVALLAIPPLMAGMVLWSQVWERATSQNSDQISGGSDGR